jgi:hypothetical protein
MKLHRKYCPNCPFVIAAAAAEEASSSKPPPMQHTTAIVYVAQQLGYSAEQINAAITACAHDYNLYTMAKPHLVEQKKKNG